MRKRKNELVELNADIAGEISMYRLKSAESKLSVLASALWIVTQKTTLESDAKEIIQQVYPAFFEDESSQQTERREGE